jgi:DNA-binding NarL/FixJ family response regulator
MVVLDRFGQSMAESLSKAFSGRTVIKTYADPLKALACMILEPPEVCLVPGESENTACIDVVRQLALRRPRVRTIVYMHRIEPSVVSEFHAVGADAFVVQPTTAEQLCEALREAHKPWQVTQLAKTDGSVNSTYESGPTTSGPVLTPRESEVLPCLLSHLTDKQIATKLGVEVSTVKSYVHRLLAKFGARSRGRLCQRIPSDVRNKQIDGR